MYSQLLHVYTCLANLFLVIHGKYLMLACSENFHLINFTGLANYASIVFLTTVDLPIKSIILLIQGNCNVVYNDYIA